MMNYLIAQSADLTLTVKGLIWGKGYEWETFIPWVNPISYAMMGLLRQFQRKEELIYKVVSILIKAAYGIDYIPSNIPNAYLKVRISLHKKLAVRNSRALLLFGNIFCISFCKP